MMNNYELTLRERPLLSVLSPGRHLMIVFQT